MLRAEPMTISPQDLLFEAACVACRAPSIANSQPWLWRVSGNALELRCDQSRQLAVTDPHGQLMVMSCGALLHHASVALAALGAAVTVERIDDSCQRPGNDPGGRTFVSGLVDSRTPD